MHDDEVKEYIKSHPEVYFERARKSGYVCPICDNGTGKDGTGMKEVKGREGLFKCFKCGFSGDVLAFIAKGYNLDIRSDFSKVIDKAREIYGIEKPLEIRRNNVNKTQKQIETDLPDTFFRIYFEKVAKDQSNYLDDRGISKKIQKEFKIGYDKKWKHPANPNISPSERIIIPTSKNSYLARAINQNTDEKYKAIKVGKSHIFNSKILSEECDEPIFIVEGEIDALSIIEVGGKAIGLGGTSNTELLKRELVKEKKKFQAPLILCLDNDDAGNEASKKIEEFLTEMGIIFINGSKTVLGNFKDPNEALVKDRDFFAKAVKALAEDKKSFENAKSKAQEAFEKGREEYIRAHRDRIADACISFYKEKKSIPTKFHTLDEFLDGGLHAGLYVLAAASGAGKTTLALQIADNIARGGQDVLFFSGEMTIQEIVAKSLSRLTKEIARDSDENALTMRTVLNIGNLLETDKDKEKIDKWIEKETLAEENYNNNIVDHMIIYDGLQSIEDINEEKNGESIISKIETHKKITRESPVIFIDYLQIIRSTKGSTSGDRRLQIDEIISKLRITAVKHETPIFIISSLNRYAYGRGKAGASSDPSDEKDIYMADLKESGGIEYGADVIMTLQAEEDNDDDHSTRRMMKLRVIKNRTGRRHKRDDYIPLDFHTWFNYFEDKGIKKGIKDDSSSQRASAVDIGDL